MLHAVLHVAAKSLIRYVVIFLHTMRIEIIANFMTLCVTKDGSITFVAVLQVAVRDIWAMFVLIKIRAVR